MSNSHLRILFVSLFLFSCTCSYAQHFLHGKVIDEKAIPISGASVSLLHPGTQVVLNTKATSGDGSYNILLHDTLAILLQVSANGYATQIRAVMAADTGEGINFALTKELVLGEVSITARKPVIEEKVDRTIFNVENSLAATGGDAIDALSSTPGVTVMRNEISVIGKGSVSVMINGRLQQVSGTDLMQLLRSIPSSNLARIEVITNPPARYDAEGDAGLINIVLKKNLKNGLKGVATTSYQYSSIGSQQTNAQLNYKKDKVDVICSIGGGVESEKYTNRTSSYFMGERRDQSFLQYERDKNISVQFGADYRINKNHIIGFRGAERLNYSDATNTASSNNYTDANILDSTIRTTGEQHDRSKGKHTLNLNYEWHINTTGKKLNIDADYYEQHDSRNRRYATQGYTPLGSAGAELPEEITADPGVIIRSVKADVEWPLKALNLSYGAKASAVNNNSNNVYKIQNSNVFVIDAARTNEFQYREQTQAAYISGERAFNKLDVQVGIRVEHTFIETYSPNTGARDTTEYVKPFPSAHMQYKINDNNILGFVYSRRISRPGYNSLNPFRFYMGSNMYMTGNPALRPSFIDGLEVSYRLKGRYSMRIFARQTDNYSDRIYVTDTAINATILTRANMGTASSIGASISAQHSVTKWWDIRASISVIHQNYSLDFYNAHTRLKDEFEWGDISNTFYLNAKKTLSLELYNYYYTPRYKDYKKWSSMSTVDVNARWLLLNKNLLLALHLEDLMAKAYWQQTNIINGTSEYSYDNSRGGRISVTYKFGNKNVKVRDNDYSNEDIQRANQR